MLTPNERKLGWLFECQTKYVYAKKYYHITIVIKWSTYQEDIIHLNITHLLTKSKTHEVATDRTIMRTNKCHNYKLRFEYDSNNN